MNDYFPIAKAISIDAEHIIISLNGRTEEIKKKNDAQGFLKKITITVSKVLGISSGMIGIASLATAAITITTPPLIIAAISFASLVTWLAISTLLDPHPVGESIVRDRWRSLFDSLKKEDGEEILKHGKNLLKQREHRASSFEKCVGELKNTFLNTFLKKTNLVAYLLIAVKCLHNDAEEDAKTNAYLALSHFPSSGFPKEVEVLAQKIAQTPKAVTEVIKKHKIGRDINSLDRLIALLKGS